MRFLIMCTLVAGMSLSAPHCFPQRRICDDAPTIVPGEAIGKLKLGMPVEEVAQLLGKPDLSEKNGKAGNSEWRQLYYYPSSDVQVEAQDGRVVKIMLGSGTQDTLKCSTSEGLRLGSQVTGKVKKSLGEPDGKDNAGGVIARWVYNKRGLELLVNPQGQVLAIVVFLRGTYCSVSEAEGTMGWVNHACADFKPPLSPSLSTPTP